MEEKKFVNVRKEEHSIKQFVKKTFGKGKISSVRIEYTPVGEKIIVSTHKPGLVIGKRGEKIAELTEILKKRFKMENPHIDIDEIKNSDFDAQLIADEIALLLERFGSLRYKSICYKILTRIKDSGALGAEIRVSGKLPSDRARSWRFAFGYLKKTGNASNIVDRAEAVAETMQGVVGVKVYVLAPDSKIHDQIDIDEETLKKIKMNSASKQEEKNA
jgi:small subunit ribosomal protein S3